MTFRRLLACLTCLVLVCSPAATPARAQPLPTATPESVGLSSERLALVTEALQKHVDEGDVAGVVAAVARHGKLVYFEAFGQRDIASTSPMPEDALFRMYSMTRPVTSLAAMILWEEGRFRLDDPVAKYLDAFTSQRVFLDADNPQMDRTRARTREMTVEHLLLHTSGLGSRSAPIYVAAGVRSRSISSSLMTANAARVPLFEDPGTRWRYGISTTVLGRLVEIWSGMTLDAFLQERVVGPLGMTDTVFWVDPERAKRLATVYKKSSDGVLEPVELEDVPFTDRPKLIEGGVGLVSTTGDFLRLSQMFLNRGELDGKRLVRPQTIEAMTVNRVPDALMPIGFGRPMMGVGWTLGFCVVMDASQYTYPMTEGEFWWDGSAGTRFWIDPAHDMVTLVNAQIFPAGGNGFREEFKTLVYAALVDGSGS